MNEKITSTKEIKKAEISVINGGLTEQELIDRASSALAEFVIKRANNGKILIVAGGGNNGCDGLQCAQKLANGSEKVELFLPTQQRNPYNLELLRNAVLLGATVVDSIERQRYEIIVDAIFGIGLNRKVEGEEYDAIKKINESDATVISVDIPSGLNADDGEVLGIAVEADETLTFGAIKSGMILGKGRDFCGQITVSEIGINPKEIGFVTASKETKIERRKASSHKGNYGSITVIGGTNEMVGAPLLSYETAQTSLRSGAGKVTLCVPNDNMSFYAHRVKETMLCGLKSTNGKIQFDKNGLDRLMDKSDVICIGMGIGISEEITKTILYLNEHYTKTLIVDADGLNSIAKNVETLKFGKAKIILTPHIGEFNRLIRQEGTLVERAKMLAKSVGGVVAVKSATTIITDGERVRFNITGTPALAKGGSGDVLAGLVSAFSCVENDNFSAVVKACYHFGKAGERAVKRLNSEVSVLASDVIIELAGETER